MAENNELERTLWATADKMRSNMDAAEYKHVVLGLIFLKYISDAFNDMHGQLIEGKGEFEGANPEDPMNTVPTMSFLFLKLHVGDICKTAPSNPKSENLLTMQWMRLKKSILHSKAFYPKSTLILNSTNNAWANS